MINNNLSQGSGQATAKIYQFPVGGRAALGGRRYGETGRPTDHLGPHATETVYSGSWYHQEAIEEAKPKWDR